MDEKKSNQEGPDPEKLAALKRLPKGVMETLTGEEVKAFLHDEKWPESLKEKLKNYLVDEK